MSSLKNRLEKAFEKAGLSDCVFVTESHSTNSVYVHLMFCSEDIRISDHTKKNVLGEVDPLDIAWEISYAAEEISEILEKDGEFTPSQIQTLKNEFEKISNGIYARRENLEKAREVSIKKREERRLLAIKQAEEFLNSNHYLLNSIKRKNGLFKKNRHVEFYSLLNYSGIKISRKDAYSLYAEKLWEQEQEKG
jgi:hypothetical protein